MSRLIAILALAGGTPALAQQAPAADPQADHAQMDHQSMDHSTMDHSAMGHGQMDHGAMPEAGKPQAEPAAMDHSTMSGMDHGEMDHGQMDHAAIGHGPAPTAVGDTPAPAVPGDHYADRFFDPAAMAHARHQMMREGGGGTFRQIFFNLAEYQARKGEDGYRWDGEGWFGGDVNRLTVKTEGEGGRRSGVGAAEVQALYSRAVGVYFNLQAGVRQDLGRGPDRTYATIGFEGLAPYMFEVEGALFLSDKGDLLARAEGWYDQRVTQRLILQPRIELNFAAQDVPEQRIGSGLVDAELGLRLRYEIAREFAPYVGISWEGRAGRSADYARLAGDDPTSTSFVAGIRFWF